MTPAETEHFAALRMHVAHFHAVLKPLIESDGIVNYDSVLCWGCGKPEPGKARAKMRGFVTPEAMDQALAEIGAGHTPDCILERARLVLGWSEQQVGDLVKEADRDNALVQCRADLAAAVDATVVIGTRCTSIESASRQLVAVYRREDAGSEEWAGALTAAVEDLAKVLPA